MSPRGGGLNRRNLKNHHLKQLCQQSPDTPEKCPEFLGSPEIIEKSPDTLDQRLCREKCALPKPGATGFANLEPPSLPGSASPLSSLFSCLKSTPTG
jgi:hypothetical protein